MDNLNIEFLEAYKRLERLCNDIYETEKGVTSYIDNMKEIPSAESRFVVNWQNDLNVLMNLRRTRNLLTHEEGTMNRQMCDAADVRWLNDFKERILKQDDPISRLHLYRRRISEVRPVNRVVKPALQPKTTEKNDSFKTDVTKKKAFSLLNFLMIVFSVVAILAAALLIIALILLTFG